MPDKMTVLPIFPLKLVVYPGEEVNLHIFEPRYKQLINDCYENKSLFGIPTFIQNELMPVGTSIKLKNIEKKYADGKMDIKTQGQEKFIMLNVQTAMPDKLYVGAEIDWLDDQNDGDPELDIQICNLVNELWKLSAVQKHVDPAEFSVYHVAHHVGLEINEEYQLLSLSSLKAKQLFLLDHLNKFMPQIRKVQEISEKAKMNGHFRAYKSPDILP